MTLAALPTYTNIDRTAFEQTVVPSGLPAIFRGLVRHWPVCSAAAQSHAALASYLKQLDVGSTVAALVGPAEMAGRYFYDDAMRGFNFQKRDVRFAEIIDRLVAIADDPKPMAIYAGSTEAAKALPGFATAHPMPLLSHDIPPRLWLGNASRIAAHFDIANNIACVVGGTRRFTLFPPDQIGNLYIGPLDFNMAGQPASLVDFAAPDFDRFPKFRAALDAAHVIDLEPGDAIYVPALWWHHVEAYGPLNLLVNYWWQGPGDGPAFESLVLGLLGLRDRAPAEKAAWRSFFEHYVFSDTAAKAADHVPEHARSVLGAATRERAAKMLAFVMSRLSQR